MLAAALPLLLRWPYSFFTLLGLIGWAGFVFCVLVIFAGAAREVDGARRDMKRTKQSFENGSKVFGGHS
jgi:hypothetical protein